MKQIQSEIISLNSSSRQTLEEQFLCLEEVLYKRGAKPLRMIVLSQTPTQVRFLVSSIYET